MFIDNVNQAYKLGTIWVGAAATIWSQLPPNWQDASLSFLHMTAPDLVGAVGVVTMIVRVLKQKGLIQ